MRTRFRYYFGCITGPATLVTRAINSHGDEAIALRKSSQEFLTLLPILLGPLADSRCHGVLHELAVID